MSEEETKTEETTTAEETLVETVPEPETKPIAEQDNTKPELKPTDVGDKASDISGSIGTGKQVFSGMCRLCGARIASGVVNTDGKIHCPTCKGDF